MGTLAAVAMVFVGCCCNVVFLELLIRESPSCGTTATFSQFLVLAVDGFVRTSSFGTAKRAIPLRSYFVMVSLFFVTSVVNNLAFNFHVSMPLHLIFRSGSLMANLILGRLLMRKSYIPSKYISVMMISVGICMATLASVHQSEVKEGDDDDQSFIHWLIGITILTVALFLSALMGLYQENVYRTYGKHPSEALFYNHALPLPFFLFFYKDLIHHVHVFNQSEVMFPDLLPVPKLWLYILGNIITQYVCIKSVFILTTECASLTVTLVVTLRKFVSLLFSILYFSNPFTPQHCVGSVFVFGGTLLFAGVFDPFFGSIGGTGGKEGGGEGRRDDEDCGVVKNTGSGLVRRPLYSKRPARLH